MTPMPMHKNGNKKSEGSNLTFEVEIIIKAGKVVCIRNLDSTLPSFSEIKLYFFIRKPIRIKANVMIKVAFA
jgi:hypothetical protein